MRSFVHMRHYIKYNEQFLPYIYLLLEEKVENNTKRIRKCIRKYKNDGIIVVKNYLSIIFIRC